MRFRVKKYPLMRKLLLLMTFAPAILLSSVYSADTPLPPFTDTLTLYMQEKPVGRMISSLRSTHRTIVNEIALSVTLAGGDDAVIAMDLHERRSYDGGSGMLIEARQEMESPSGNNSWLLRKKKNTWELAVTTAGTTRSRHIEKVNENCNATIDIYRRLMRGKLHPGDRWVDTVFELTSGTSYTQVTRCEEEPDSSNDSCWKFICSDALTGRDEQWLVNRNGKTVSREVYPYAARRTASVQHMAEHYPDIYALTRIPVPSAPDPDKEVVAVTIENEFSIDTAVTRFYDEKDGVRYLKPLKRSCVNNDNLLSDEEQKRFLQPTATLQCDHPRIKELAERLQAGGKAPCQQVAEYTAYVFNAIKKRNSATFSNAVETLKAGYGDCGEHAVLLAALLRASGIPARVVLGLLYSKRQKGYFYHAWVMCHIDDWVFADPSHNEFPAYANRIPLSIDDDGTNLVAVSRVVGRISIAHIARSSLNK
jgi:transglutaminase-like putative cysteine protease